LLVLRRTCGGEGLSELFHTERCENGHDIRIVREVEVEGLIEWEGRVHAVEGGVDVGAAGGEIVDVVR
jgi:hypothetical protein